jgi:hypothetical protein
VEDDLFDEPWKICYFLTVTLLTRESIKIQQIQTGLQQVVFRNIMIAE